MSPRYPNRWVWAALVMTLQAPPAVAMPPPDPGPTPAFLVPHEGHGPSRDAWHALLSCLTDAELRGMSSIMEIIRVTDMTDKQI